MADGRAMRGFDRPNIRPVSFKDIAPYRCGSNSLLALADIRESLAVEDLNWINPRRSRSESKVEAGSSELRGRVGRSFLCTRGKARGHRLFWRMARKWQRGPRF